jgi:acetyl/propionyl-CoA carboxylase alpha subunit
LNNFSSTRALVRPLKLKVKGKTLLLQVTQGSNAYTINGLGDETIHIAQSQIQRCTLLASNQGVWVKSWLNPQAVLVEDETLLSASALGEGVFQPNITSPMNGKITQVLVQPGQQLEAGAVLVCLEAMKMEHRITVKSAAVVEAVHVNVGDQMKLKQIMVQLKPAQ